MTASETPAAAPLAQDYTVIFEQPGGVHYVEGSGMVKLDNALIAVVPVIPRPGTSEDNIRRVELPITHILRSEDGGKNWLEVSQLPKLYSAVPFTHDGKLYLFGFVGGLKLRNDDLYLLRSDDGGRTWTEPVRLFEGHFWNCHTGMVVKDNRLYWTVDDISPGMGLRGPRMVSGDLSKDLMDPASWRISEPVFFPGAPRQLTNSKFANHGSQYLESNVLNVYGKIRVLVTVKLNRMSTTGLAAVLDLKDDGEKLDLKFTQYFPMPGAQLKFGVVWDEKSRMFWRVANLPVDSQDLFDWWSQGHKKGNLQPNSGSGNDRRFLMLFYSLDGLNWFQAGCVAQAKKLSQSFMYGMLLIDGDDLAIISRSSINAPHQHDADAATFHRVKNFRRLALNLFPEGE